MCIASDIDFKISSNERYEWSSLKLQLEENLLKETEANNCEEIILSENNYHPSSIIGINANDETMEQFVIEADSMIDQTFQELEKHNDTEQNDAAFNDVANSSSLQQDNTIDNSFLIPAENMTDQCETIEEIYNHIDSLTDDQLKAMTAEILCLFDEDNDIEKPKINNENEEKKTLDSHENNTVLLKNDDTTRILRERTRREIASLSTINFGKDVKIRRVNFKHK